MIYALKAGDLSHLVSDTVFTFFEEKNIFCSQYVRPIDKIDLKNWSGHPPKPYNLQLKQRFQNFRKKILSNFFGTLAKMRKPLFSRV